MRIRISVIFAFLFFAAAVSYTQTYRITGRIVDAKTNKALPFASVKVAESNTGTTSDDKGNFILKVRQGSYNLITSYIGYYSDTSNFYVTDSDLSRDIFLHPSEIFTDVIEVAGEDPAYGIIRKAIMYKRSFKKDLREYNYDAFTKFVVRSSVNPFSDEKTEKDSSGLSILGILESETEGYFKQPDLEKQIVKSKRETANISRGFAIPYIVNFYDEYVDLGEAKIPGPLSDDAFDNYEYKLLGTVSMDSNRIFKIRVTNTSSVRPQFAGNIYIADSVYALMKVDLETKGEALSNIDVLKFRQKFSEYNDAAGKRFWMPNDVQIFAQGTFAGLIKFKGDAFTIISAYRLNEKAPEGLFDEIIVKVNKDAQKDSSYWKNNQLIKNSDEEKSAYKTIEKTTAERQGKIRFGGLSLNIGKYFSTDLTNLYQFNSVEGSRVGLKLNYNRDFGRTYSSLFYGYGFADKKAKYDFTFNTRLLPDGSLRLGLSSFKSIESPFMNRDWVHEMVNSYYTLFTKKERYYYYYRSGFSFDIYKSIIPQIGIKAGYIESKESSAKVNTDYSFFSRDKRYAANPTIGEGFKRTLSLALTLDLNKYKGVDWGTGEISRFPVTEFPSLTFKVENSSANLGSTFDFRKYTVELSGENNFMYRIKPKYLFGFRYANGNIPFQDLPYFNVFSGTGKMQFAAMDYGEFGGEKLFYALLENDFGKIFPSSIPVMKSINLIGLFYAGRSFMSDELSTKFKDNNINKTDGLFMETGFALDKIFDIIRLDFALRL
ncbi:MAG: DUF5686 and carboxypeptidase regulatory-like domain-containing protein, partial [Bacteroidetes bacterium]|nr:DUF5686 and carboxypeptidase regulatory-like domain-containing protein [Bacteroidota bacterium]